MENICRFVSSFETTDTVNTLHFVYENHPVSNEKFVIQAAFMLYLVAAGEGRCVTPAGACALAPGDIFFNWFCRFSFLLIGQIQLLKLCTIKPASFLISLS